MSKRPARAYRPAGHRLSSVRQVSAPSPDTLVLFYLSYILLILREIDREREEKDRRCQVSEAWVMQARDQATANRPAMMRSEIHLTPSDSCNSMMSQVKQASGATSDSLTPCAPDAGPSANERHSPFRRGGGGEHGSTPPVRTPVERAKRAEQVLLTATDESSTPRRQMSLGGRVCACRVTRPLLLGGMD